MIFLDANFIIAYFVKKDKYHNDAQKIWKNIENEEKIISKTIVVEVFNTLNVQLKENIELSSKIYNNISDFTIMEDHFYHDEAFKVMIEYYSDNRLPFADCLYIALMKKLGIKQIATFDKHFNNIDGIERIY